ncbi:MAG: efflux RND transporter periplasmic adaptor subunit [Spirochaetales bacterium]|nr:efflux RND transporter periplasmic adaptor subunit [Spirochaetales bacterium]
MNTKKKRKNRTTGLVLVIAIVGLAGFMGVSAFIGASPIAGNAEKARQTGMDSMGSGRPGSGQDMPEETVYSVLTQSVETGTIEDYLKFNGDVITDTSVEIYPDATGELTKLHVSLGDYVRKGDVIAEVDPSLPGHKYVASPVKATINGTITDLPYKVGATISSPQVPVATVGDLSSLQVQSYISEKDMARVELGQIARISFEPFGNELFEGVISEISPVLDRDSRTLEIKLILTDNDSRIKSGMFGSVYLITDTLENALIIPTSSILNSNEGSYVYTVDSSDKAEMRMIKTGLAIDGSTVVLEGLSAGDRLVTLGQTMLQSGSSVRVNS